MIDRDEVARRLRAGMDDKGRQVTTAWWLDWMVMGTDRDSNGNLWSTAATLGRLAELIESAPMDRCTNDWCEIEPAPMDRRTADWFEIKPELRKD